MRSRAFIALQLCAAVCLAAAPAQEQPTKPAADVYVVPFSHLDLFWGGTREECLSRGNRILTKAIQLAERYPEFRFLVEDEVFAADFVDSHRGLPELEALKRLVKEGRIELAPKWAGIYQNLPRGEAQVRNLAIGKRYARQVFGVDPKVAHLGDLPGYTSQYAQILAQTGTPYMVMTRMGPTDVSLFRWKAPDGSGVLAWHAIKGYSWGSGLGLHRDLDESRIARIRKEVSEVQATTSSPVYLGWGTDLWSPSEKLVENTALLNKTMAPWRFRLATPEQFFRGASAAPDIPELSGEIPSSWANILTSMGHIWPPALAGSDALLLAEKLAAINYALGYAEYPEQEFESLWKYSLESMDHNNYGQGGNIGDSRKVGYAQLASLRGGQIARDMARNIAERVRNPIPRSMAIVVFNPLNWRRDDIVRAHATLYGDVPPSDIADFKKSMRLVDETGTAVPFHVLEYSENISRAVDIIFVARGVPSLGYKTYYLAPAGEAAAFPDASELKLDSDLDAKQPRRVVGAEIMENEYYRVTVDRATGRIEVFDKGLNRTVAKDLEIAGTEERGGNTLAIEPRTGRMMINVISRVEVEENNPVRTVIRIAGDIAGIPIVQRVTLYRGLKKVDLENTVDWKPGRFVKLEQLFPYAHPGARIRYGIPFGSADGENVVANSGPRFSDEVPKAIWMQWRQIQDWVFAGDAEWGVTVSADRQLVSLEEGVIRAGMLRGTRFNPLNIVRDGKTFLLQQPPADTYTFRYSLTSGKGNWATAKSFRAGMEFASSLFPYENADDLTRKTLPSTNSFCSLDADNLVVSALKKADGGDAIVLRAFEILGSAAETPVSFLGEKSSFRTVNMLEEGDAAEAQSILRVRPFEIRTLKLNPRTRGGGL
jgi:alpha-mannosidase